MKNTNDVLEQEDNNLSNKLIELTKFRSGVYCITPELTELIELADTNPDINEDLGKGISEKSKYFSVIRDTSFYRQVQVAEEVQVHELILLIRNPEILNALTLLIGNIVSTSTTVKKVDFTESVRTESIILLSDALSLSDSIEEVDFSKNRLEEYAPLVLASLTSKGKISIVSFRSCDITNCEETFETALKLRIKTIDLSHNIQPYNYFASQDETTERIIQIQALKDQCDAHNNDKQSPAYLQGPEAFSNLFIEFLPSAMTKIVGEYLDDHPTDLIIHTN